MYKIARRLLVHFIIFSYIGLIFIMPFKWHNIAPYSEIFPAFDLILIYFLSTHKTIKNWQLFLIGLLIDQLYQIPLGSSSLTLIIANLGLNHSKTWFALKDYHTNLLIFCVYSLFVISTRYLIVTIDSTHYIEGNEIYFYYLTTIFSYPIIYVFIQKPINLIKDYAR
jgi:cell shape-determining protein MreD